VNEERKECKLATCWKKPHFHDLFSLTCKKDIVNNVQSISISVQITLARARLFQNPVASEQEMQERKGNAATSNR
jgi:hypothetical protein